MRSSKEVVRKEYWFQHLALTMGSSNAHCMDTKIVLFCKDKTIGAKASLRNVWRNYIRGKFVNVSIVLFCFIYFK